jgi:predicted nucleic acid-binding protein
MKRWKISFWDGLVIAAARESGASVIWSEDLSTGRNYDGITIVDPLK